VHFLRFELTKEMKRTLQNGAGLAIGVDHPAYSSSQQRLPEPVLRSLREDLA